jgi:plasmid stabilization system protein ParE
MQAKPQLEWRQQALDDLAEIIGFIADDNPDAAQELKDEIEMVVRKNYIVLYRVTLAIVEVVNVLHARRHWPV